MKKPEDLKKLITSTGASVESKEEHAALPKTDDPQDLFTRP
jgi:hypothetical protein